MPDAPLGQQLHPFEPKPGRAPTRLNRASIIAIAIIVGALLAGFSACAVVVGNINEALNEAFTEQHLKPIPVPRSSCPYLRRVHDTAAIAGHASGAGQNSNERSTWRSEALSLVMKLTAFARSLQSASKHTPRPIANRLGAVHDQVKIGINRVARARTGREWSGDTFVAITKGYGSLSDASDLTGDACGFTLAPGSQVFFNAVTVPAP